MTLIPPNATRRANDHDHESHSQSRSRIQRLGHRARRGATTKIWARWIRSANQSFLLRLDAARRSRPCDVAARRFGAICGAPVDARAFERARAFGLAVPHAAVKKSSTYARADEAESYRSLWLSDRARWLEAQKRRWVRLRLKIREARERGRERERVPERAVISTSEAVVDSARRDRRGVDVGDGLTRSLEILNS